MAFGDDGDPHAQDLDLDDATYLDGPLDDDSGNQDANDLGGEGDDASANAPGERGDESQDGGQGRVPPVKAPGRGERRIQSLLERTRQAEARAEEAHRIAEEARRDRQQQTQRESAEQRAQRLAGMSDWERAEYLQTEQREYFDSQLNALRFETASTRDKATFEAACIKNPQLDKIADEVEAEHDRLVRQGRPTERMVIAQWLIGKSVIERAGQAKARQGNRGAQRIAGETTRPPNPRGQAPAGRTKAGADLESRLRGKTI